MKETSLRKERGGPSFRNFIIKKVISVTERCLYRKRLSDGGESFELAVRNNLVRTFHHSAEINYESQFYLA